MRIIFVRHGQDDETRRGGWSSYGLLTEGHLQAKKVADHVCNQTSYQIGAIYASDLNRTMETAAFFSDALKLPVQKVPALREINNGDLAGMPNEEALVKFPSMFFSSLKMDEKYPGGESPREFYDRIKTRFSDFLAENRDNQEDVLIVTHGGVIKILYYLVKGEEWTNKSNTVSTGKCSIHVLDVDTMTWKAENQIVWQ